MQGNEFKGINLKIEELLSEFEKLGHLNGGEIVHELPNGDLAQVDLKIIDKERVLKKGYIDGVLTFRIKEVQDA